MFGIVESTSILVLLSSNTVLILMTCSVLSVLVFFFEISSASTPQKSINEKTIKSCCSSKATLPRPPGPKPYPIIGNLPCLDGFDVPYQAFDELAKKFGSIISLRLGSVPTIVVNGIENIKEVLITKASHFDSRPNFRRYHDLFSGNKQNCKSQYLVICRFKMRFFKGK